MVHSLQITFGSTGVQQVKTLLPAPQNQMAAFVTFQNTGTSGTARLGDSSVSSTKGIQLLSNGGSESVPLSISRAFLPGYYIYAPSGTVIDIMYEDI